MSNSMRTGKSNQTRSGKNGGNFNVTQKQNQRQGTNRGKVNHESAKVRDEEFSNSSTRPAANERYAKPHKSGGASSSTTRNIRSKSGNTRADNADRSDVSRAEKPGKRVSELSTAGLPRVDTRGADRGTSSGVRANDNARTSNRQRKETVNLSSSSSQVINFLIALWRCLFDDLCPKAKPYFEAALCERGYKGMISWFSSLASHVINNTNGSILEDEFLYVLRTECSDIKDILQLLRFGKRFAESTWDGSEEVAILSSFKTRNNRCKQLDRHEVPEWIRQAMAYVKSLVFPSDFSVTMAECTMWDRKFESDWQNLPSGTTAEGYRNEFEKWLAISCAHRRIDPMISQGYSYTPIEANICHNSGYTHGVNSCKLVFVPKDYRGPRLIMEQYLETTLRQTVVADELLSFINSPCNLPYHPYGLITLDDQRRNQEMAQAGAQSKYFATIDLSNASDSICTRLLYDALPVQIAESISKLCVTDVELTDGKHMPLYIPCTMGSRLTVPAQSLVYWVCVATAVEIGYRFGICDRTCIQDVSVYNDDIIVPCSIYDIVTMILTKVGLVVNDDKSYTDDHPFRESCGVDCYDDDIVTSVYWPRKDIQLTREFLPSLCGLQNKLCTIHADHAAQLVMDTVLRIEPKTPIRLPGDETTSLWSYKSNYTVDPYPAAHKLDVPVPDGIGLMTTYELRQTYNNQLVTHPNLVDGRYLTPEHLKQLAERFEYEYWLLFGSQYYDVLCEYLHVTMPIHRRKHLVPKGYVAKKTFSCVAEVSALERGSLYLKRKKASHALLCARKRKEMDKLLARKV